VHFNISLQILYAPDAEKAEHLFLTFCKKVKLTVFLAIISLSTQLKFQESLKLKHPAHCRYTHT
jgi:hypothetical protein